MISGLVRVSATTLPSAYTNNKYNPFQEVGQAVYVFSTRPRKLSRGSHQNTILLSRVMVTCRLPTLAKYTIGSWHHSDISTRQTSPSPSQLHGRHPREENIEDGVTLASLAVGASSYFLFRFFLWPPPAHIATIACRGLAAARNPAAARDLAIPRDLTATRAQDDGGNQKSGRHGTRGTFPPLLHGDSRRHGWDTGFSGLWGGWVSYSGTLFRLFRFFSFRFLDFL